MFFRTTDKGTRRNIAFALLLSLAAFLALVATGCAPVGQPHIVPAHYDVRETDNGVYIFEYNAGNQGQNSGDSLTMFTDSLNTWTKAHPELSVTRLERMSTNISYKDQQNQARSITVVNVLVYTAPSGKPALPKVVVPPKDEKPEEKK